jgi:hypothetical protein
VWQQQPVPSTHSSQLKQRPSMPQISFQVRSIPRCTLSP